MVGTLVPGALDPSLYIPELKCRRRDTALAELVACGERGGALRHPEALLELLARREALGCTAPGKSVAIPAARSLSILHPRILVGRSHRGIEWNAPDGLPVRLIALVLSPAECPAFTHLEIVLRVVVALRLQRNRQRILEAESFDAMSAALRETLP